MLAQGPTGICPGNRLRLLAGVYDTGQLLADTGVELNTLQRQGKRRSWHVQPNKCLLFHLLTTCLDVIKPSPHLTPTTGQFVLARRLYRGLHTTGNKGTGVLL
ncbi:unnamed protein product [Timema podura]|uniref:Uncharacterized protein n=1 Tax=Timema podura TaxID=61482 RepID=A0ABN7PNN7_TIMPD|nr:unnamed protein product [Timema podura]